MAKKIKAKNRTKKTKKTKQARRVRAAITEAGEAKITAAETD